MQRGTHDFAEHRRGNLPPVIFGTLRIIYHHRDYQARIRDRRETDERCDIMVDVMSILQLMRGAGLAGHAITGHLCQWSCPARQNHLFHHVAHLTTVRSENTLFPVTGASSLSNEIGFNSPSLAKMVYARASCSRFTEIPCP